MNAVPPTLFGRRRRHPAGGRTPVIVVTGFLGAGKTTLIREFLRTPAGAGSAVVVNEFGEIGIDDALLRASSDATVLLGNGCLCCSMRTDLQETLSALVADRARGAVPSFERVIVETSGLVDPHPVLQTFLTDRALAREFHLLAMICVVDLATIEQTLESAPEARKQLMLADRIIVTKSDLIETDIQSRVLQRIRSLANPDAPIETAAHGRIDPQLLLQDCHVMQSPGGDTIESGEHSEGIQTFTIGFDRPLAWDSFAQAMAALASLRGPDLWRVKGLLDVRGCKGPVVVHFVQHLAHAPVELERWPEGGRESRLVFVTRNISRSTVQKLIDATQEAAAVD